MRFFLFLFLAAALTALADDTNNTVLNIHVTSQSGKPIGNASVVVRFVEGKIVKLNRAHKEWELRTSEEGTAKTPPMPKGKILVQVIAKNYQTFGQTFDVQEDQKTIDVVLNPPQKQYSAHEAH